MEDKRTYRFEIRLSEEEYQLFKRKAKRYQTVSAMVRDAVKSFNDVHTQGKIDALTELKKYYISYNQRLGWMGGNINQAQHRANELAIAGELSPEYIKLELLPRIQEAVKLIRDMQSQLDSIYAKILKL